MLHGKGSLLLWLGVLALLLAPLALQATPAVADGWVIECVDCPKQFSNMSARSLRLDAEGHPHMAYGADHLYYAWHDGISWHYETVDDSPGVGLYASLALDESGYPHISYYDFGRGNLKYAYEDASGWHIGTVDSEGWVGWYTSLALDGSGYPHISYYGNYNLKYAYQDASGWYIETVDTGGWVGEYTSLDLDEDGYPHISYYYCGAFYKYCSVGDLKYAYRDDSGWHIQTVDSEGDVGWDTSLALDEGGYPHISYSRDGLKYVYQDTTGWHIETVDSEGGAYTSLALDGDGHPHISYGGNGDLKYAYQNASGWHVESVDGERGMYTSLALDGRGYPHISYYYYYYCGTVSYPYCNVGDLKYAYRGASNWHIKTVDSEGDVGEHTSLALDGSGYPHISYHDWWNDNLKYAYQDASGWHIETVDSEREVGQYTSLAVDEDGYPHISYYDSFHKDLKYAYQNASGWHIETVDGEGDVGYYTSLALEGTGYPHISYYDRTQDDLKYAYQDASGWHIETVDSKGDVGEHTSLVLDEGGYPHISYFSYFDTTNSDLKYAHQDASGWYIETVDIELGYLGSYTSLALDGGGYPHISYYDAYPNYNLRYAHQDASGWHIETVDSEGDVGQYTSLAVDEDGYPHISYASINASGLAADDLKYAYQDASGWHIETVDSEGQVGSFTSLALDERGYPHISYYHSTNGDLNYTYSVPWLNWREPGRPLLLPPRGATVDVAYGNIRYPTTLTATLSGPAVFADGSQVLTANITEANGSYALPLKPATGATTGDTFTLEVTLDGLQLDRVGAIAWEVYLPLIFKKTS